MKLNKRNNIIAAGLLCALAGLLPAPAQNTNATGGGTRAAHVNLPPGISEGKGIIEGYVTHADTGLPIAKARAIVRPAFQEALTDDEGRFRLAGVPAGESQVEITYLGFVRQNAAVTVAPDATVRRDFTLAREQAGQTTEDSVVVMKKFSVVADRMMTAQALAMNEQRHAANIKNVIAFEELSDQGQENIGDYIRFMPGVAIVDSGEDSTLALGGFPPEMSTLRLDGGDVASTGVGDTSSRTLSLSQVPMVNIESIEVSKVPTPDMPATGLGGSVNLVTKSIVGTKKPKFSYRLYTYFDSNGGLAFDGGPKQAPPRCRRDSSSRHSAHPSPIRSPETWPSASGSQGHGGSARRRRKPPHGI